MTLEHVQAILATAGAPWASAFADTLRAAGAEIVACPAEGLLPALDASPHHLVIVGDTGPGLPKDAVVALLDGHPRRWPVPLLVVLGPGEPLPSILRAGAAAVIAADAPAPRLVSAVANLAGPAIRAAGAEALVGQLKDDVRARQKALDQTRRRMEILEHEVKTPLGIVVGFASNLRDLVDGPLSPEQRKNTERIVTAALRAGTVVEQALTQARDAIAGPAEPAEAGTSLFRRQQRTHFDLAALLRDTVDLFRGQAAERQIALKFGAPQPIFVWGDAPKLTQVMTNLLVNALKFTPAGGAGVVECQVGLAEGDAELRRQAELRVVDNGPGVPAELRDRVFEPTFRLARDHAVPGKGLGLAVCREVVHLHRGRIFVEEAAVGGAAFVVRLPLDLRTRARGPS
jgi:signal transduction histidine kinase